MAVRQTPNARDRIATSLAGAASGPAWRVFIDRLTVDAAIIRKGLASPSPAVRDATIWFVVSDARAGRAIRAADLKSAMNSTQATPPTDETEWGAFGRELIARRFGKADVTDGSGAIRRHALKNRSDASALVSGSKLTNDERAALREVLPRLFSDRAVKPGQPADPLEAEANPALLPTRTFPTVAPGLFASLLDALGCTPPSDLLAFGAARILYQLDGRPSALAADTRTLPKACVPFIGYLARLTVSQPDQPVLNGIPQWLFMAMDKDAIACAEEGVARSSASRVAEPVTAGRITVPRKTKDVRPVYPQTMQRAGISGTVIIRTTITATGCIGSAEVLRSVELPLDLAAMRAVSGWRFEPALLDETPVPVILTVTVGFRLQ
jgi:TonB family protein